jgi:hypothetical protein
MKFLAAASNKKVILPVILAFTFISILFIFNMSNKRFNSYTTTEESTTTNPSGDHHDMYKQKPSSYIIENTAEIEQLQVTKEEWEKCLDPGITPNEYLSIVIVTRVDNYAG